MLKKYLYLLIFILFSNNTWGVTQYSDYQAASETIGKWLSKVTEHNDFLSASPLSRNDVGVPYLIGEWSTLFSRISRMHTASDYGFSIMHAPLDSKVTAAYGTIGTNTSLLPSYLSVNRFHAAYSIGETFDFSFSYLTTNDQSLTGYGAAFKMVLIQTGPFYISYRFQYSSSNKDGFFSQQTINNDFLCSVYLTYIDIYGGVRLASGKISFVASDPALTLPDIKYIADLEYFYGANIAIFTRYRLGVQANKVGDNYSIAGKLSFFFNSLLPDFDHFFSSPPSMRRDIKNIL